MLRDRLALLIVVMATVSLLLGGCPGTKQDAATTGPSPNPASAPKLAEESGSQAPAEHTSELTKEQVKNFMRSVEDSKVDSAMTRIAEAAGAEDKRDAAAVAKVLEAASGNAELGKLVQAHGFSSASEWVETAKIVLPGMGHAMAVAMSSMTGVQEGSEEFEKMVKDSEFTGTTEAFAKPTAEQQRLMDEAVTEMVKEETGNHESQ